MTFIYRLSGFLLFLNYFFTSFISQAQYCAPVINTSGIYFVQINFNTSGFTGGIDRYTGANGGYTQTVSTTSGTMSKYFDSTFEYSVGNSTNSDKSYEFTFYVDWNRDGDFNDAGEQQMNPTVGTVTPNTSLKKVSTFSPLLNQPSGDYRVRFAVSQSGPGTSSACGSFTGEVEDYIISIAVNKAPVLTSAANLPLNSLTSSQTNSNGISLTEFVESLQPSSLITDADDQDTYFTSKAPRGIAVFGQSASNGNWQYKVGTGNWTNLPTLTNTNALLLMADAYNPNYKPGSRIRFVPTGIGNPTITFRAWDGTVGSNGSYTNISTTGGSSPYSTASLTASIQVTDPKYSVKDLYLASQNNTIYNAFIDKTNKSISNADAILANSDDYNAFDIDLETTTNKLYWISGSGLTKIASSNSDGSSAQLSLITGLNYATGIAVNNGSLYYIAYSNDYTSVDIYRAKTDGTQVTKIFTGTGFADVKDIEFYNNKLYFQYANASSVYHIASVNTDGTGLSILHSTANSFGGLAVAGGFIYWTESDGGLRKKGIVSGNATQLVSEPTRILSDLIVDDANATIYFMDNDNNSNDRSSLIRSISTSGTGLKTVSTLGGYGNSLTFNPTSVPLPVMLVSFTGRFDESNTTSILSWKTTSEENNEKFILQRSTDSRYFIPVAAISGAGTTSAINNYYYNDNIANLTAKTFYYRLLQVDFDGSYSYSRIISLARKAGDFAQIKLWPNPGKGFFTVQLGALPASSTNIEVYSTDGRLVLNDVFSTQEYQLNLANNQTGSYVVKLNLGDGEQKQFRIVKE